MKVFEENRIRMAKYLYGDRDPSMFDQFYKNYLAGDYTKELLKPIDVVKDEFNLDDKFVQMVNSFNGANDLESLRHYAETYISINGGCK